MQKSSKRFKIWKLYNCPYSLSPGIFTSMAPPLIPGFILLLLVLSWPMSSGLGLFRSRPVIDAPLRIRWSVITNCSFPFPIGVIFDPLLRSSRIRFPERSVINWSSWRDRFPEIPGIGWSGRIRFPELPCWSNLERLSWIHWWWSIRPNGWNGCRIKWCRNSDHSLPFCPPIMFHRRISVNYYF